MKKAEQLREHMTAALKPFGLDKDPDRLSVLIPKGGVQSTLTDGLAYEYAYMVELIIEDFTGHPDAIMAPLLLWIRRWQPDLLRPDAPAIDFDAEILSNKKADVAVRLALTERVALQPAAQPVDGRPAYDVVHLDTAPAPWTSPSPYDADHVANPALLHAVLVGGVVVAHCSAHPDS